MEWIDVENVLAESVNTTRALLDALRDAARAASEPRAMLTSDAATRAMWLKCKTKAAAVEELDGKLKGLQTEVERRKNAGETACEDIVDRINRDLAAVLSIARTE